MLFSVLLRFLNRGIAAAPILFFSVHIKRKKITNSEGNARPIWAETPHIYEPIAWGGLDVIWTFEKNSYIYYV